jgi:hypothetical protein
VVKEVSDERMALIRGGLHGVAIGWAPKRGLPIGWGGA